MDGLKMANDLIALNRIGESEKLTINLGVVDLGQIDLLIDEGFYSNRSDLIRTAIRNQLAIHASVVSQAVSRRTLLLGLQSVTRADLELARAEGREIHLRVVGLARIADDVTADLARATIQSVVVLGALHASPAVRRALADRIS
jgi:Arc/MetJ-type ribon-helix-helix transcriptional regulator